MRVGLDATPLVGNRTGVGRYVAGLLDGFAALNDPPEVVLTAFSWRGRGELPRHPRTARLSSSGTPRYRHGRRFPARLLQQAWLRGDWPPVEWLSGKVEVFHGTNFVLPPTRRAAGVVTIHDLTFLRHAETVTTASLRYRELVPRGLRRARAVCTVSRTVADEVVAEYGVPADRVVVTPNGLSESWLVDELKYRGVGSTRPPLPEQYLLFVGTLEPRKNVPVLLDALRRLHATDPDTPPLVLAGPSGWGPYLDCGDLPDSAVVRTGYVDEDELVSVVAGAACLVLPSRDEGFGLTPLEALAVGTPVVVSDLPVLREVLGTHATYVPVGDADALADAIAQTLAAAPTDAATAARWHAHAATFTWERCAAETMRAYRLALCP